MTKITQPAGQSILSSKHSQSAHSDEIKFNEDFNHLFELNSSDVTIRDDSDLDGTYSILLKDVKMEESDDSEFYYTNAFDVIDEANQFVFHVEEDHTARMYLSDDLLAQWKKLKDKSTPIVLDEIDDESPLFTVEVKSAELTNLIEVLQKTLNSNDHMGARTPTELCQVFADNLIKFGIKYDLVHAECVIRALLRKKSNILEYPDWSAAGDPEDYQLLSLNTALYKNPSALVSMSYGHLRRLLISAEFYDKTAPSQLDPLFVHNLADYIDQ